MLTHEEVKRLFDFIVESLERLQQNPELLQLGVCFYIREELDKNPEYRGENTTLYSYSLVNFIERGQFYYGPYGEWNPARQLLVKKLIYLLSTNKPDQLISDYITHIEQEDA